MWRRRVTAAGSDGTLLDALLERRTGKAEEAHDRLKAQLWDLKHFKRKSKRTWNKAAVRWLKEKAHKKSLRDDVTRTRWFTSNQGQDA